jgi:hypothetical protein
MKNAVAVHQERHGKILTLMRNTTTPSPTVNEARVVTSIPDAGIAALPSCLSQILSSAPKSRDDQRHGEVLVHVRAGRETGKPFSADMNARECNFVGTSIFVISLVNQAVSLELAEIGVEGVLAASASGQGTNA